MSRSACKAWPCATRASLPDASLVAGNATTAANAGTNVIEKTRTKDRQSNYAPEGAKKKGELCTSISSTRKGGPCFCAYNRESWIIKPQ